MEVINYNPGEGLATNPYPNNVWKLDGQTTSLTPFGSISLKLSIQNRPGIDFWIHGSNSDSQIRIVLDRWQSEKLTLSPAVIRSGWSDPVMGFDLSYAYDNDGHLFSANYVTFLEIHSPRGFFEIDAITVPEPSAGLIVLTGFVIWAIWKLKSSKT